MMNMNRVFEIGEELYEPVIHVKWNHFGALRRFPLAECEWDYQNMLYMIRQFEPTFSDFLCYRDEEGDKIVFTTTLEMKEMIACLKSKSHGQSPTIKIESTEKNPTITTTTTTTTSSSTATEPKPTMASRATNTINNLTSASSSLSVQHKQAMLDGRLRKVHPNVLCDLCDQKICGTRYKCLYCDDFDLCEDCEKLGAHPEHPLLRLATPETPKAYEMIYGGLGGRKHGRHHNHHSLHHNHHRRFMRMANKEFGLPPLDVSSISENDGHYSAANSRPSPPCFGQGCLSNELLRRSARNPSITTTPRSNANIPVLRPMAEMEHSVIDAQPQPLEKNVGRHDASAPKLPSKNPMPNNRPSTLPSYENARRRLTYLKEIGSHVQKALLNYGIDCEATVEDKDGKIHERLPFVTKKSGEKSAKKSSTAEKIVAKKTEEKVATASNNADAIPYLINYEREPKPTFKRKSDETAGPLGISTKTPKSSLDEIVIDDQSPSPPKVEQEKTKKYVPEPAQSVSPLLTAVNQTAQMATDMSMDALELATQLFVSMEQRELADQTNRIGLSAINGVKSSIESIATNMGPLIADLTEKCRLGDIGTGMNTSYAASNQASSTQQQNSTANSTPSTTENATSTASLYPCLFPNGATVALNAEGASRMEDDDVEELHTAVAPSPIPLSAPEPVSEAIPLPYFVNNNSNYSSSVLAGKEEEEDIDVILLSDNDEESDDGGNDNRNSTMIDEKTAIIVVAEDPPAANGNSASVNESIEEKDSTTSSSGSSGGSAASFVDGNDVDAATAYSVSDADEWMLVSKSSYKQLCDFYERRRKMDSENSDGWWDDATAAAAEGEQQLSKSQDCDSAVPITPPPETSGNLAAGASALSQVEETKHEELRLKQMQQSEGLRFSSPIEERMMKCFAGTPYYEPQQPHCRRCHITHPVPEVQSVVDMLVDMGYDNCNGWLTQLVERSPDDIAYVLDKATTDPVYQARLAESD